MNPNSETSNVFIIIKNVTPKSLLTGNMDEMERVRVILRTLKTNPKLHNVSDDTLIKEIVFLIMRNKNLNKPNVDIHMLYPMLLVGLNDANSSDLDLSQDELIDKILVQNNEVDVNNKMNVALSNVISNLPSDLESQVPPEIKSTLMEQFANSIPSYNNIRNAMNTESKQYWKSTNSDSYNRSYPYSVYGSSSNTDTTNNASSNSTDNNDNSNNNDYLTNNNVNSNNNDYLTMNMGNSYNVLSNDYDKKHRKFAEDDELLASYVDTEPEIHVDRDDNLYIHDTYSKTLHNIPDDLKNVSLEQVEEILTKHEVDAKEVDNILDQLRKEDVDSEELEKVIEEEEEETLLDIIRNYQKEYTVINYIVSVILIALLLSLIVYIVMKIRKN